MKKIILINILTIFIFWGCSHSDVDYLPAVVFVKQPEIVSVDGKNKTYIEFAVSDLNELEGNVKIEVLDSSKTVIVSKKVENLLFTIDGVLIREYLDEINASEFTLKFKVCNKDKLCREQFFEKIALNNNPKSSNLDIKGAFLSNKKSSNFKLFISSAHKLYPNKSGDFSLSGLDSGHYDVYVNGEDTNKGFYRYVYLKSINFDKSTSIFIYAPFEENEEYDKPLLNCSFSNSNHSISYLFAFFLLIILFIRAFSCKKS